MNRPLGSILFLILVTVVGCQGNKPKYANVKGKVTFNGKPIEKGNITFGVAGRTPSVMQIVDGTFNGQAMVGENRVSISALKKSPNVPKLSGSAAIQSKGYAQKFRDAHDPEHAHDDEFDTAGMVDYIPPEWGAKSKEMRVVEAGITNEFEFDIKVKN